MGNDRQGVLDTRHLIAPELLPGLDARPTFELNDELIAFLRSGSPLP
jgi:hypothetical protein